MLKPIVNGKIIEKPFEGSLLQVSKTIIDFLELFSGMKVKGNVLRDLAG